MRILVGITGASGLIYADRLLKFLASTKHHVEVVASDMAKNVNKFEKAIDFNSIEFPLYDNDDFSAPFVSGSVLYDAMTVIPCSMNSLAKIAHGIADTVITRAADVFLKEHRRLVLVPRESAYNLIHIKNMELTLIAGASVVPASPSFYSHPANIDALVDTVVARVLDNMGIENNLVARWSENEDYLFKTAPD